ncbi:jg17957 [Pararge aegeria aegeria]|uniref:Jg17957 protein n=1 Tax=Pararge aegeria aegeria TaxID=348720 RepID=A0A8S4RZN0_9NEOP|nr:jg17957 [Pararge aegeria aegeria]
MRLNIQLLYGRAVMYIVCSSVASRIRSIGARLSLKVFAVRRLRCSVLPPLEAPTRLVVTNVSDNCAASHYTNQQQNLVTDTRCARHGRYKLEFVESPAVRCKRKGFRPVYCAHLVVRLLKSIYFL